MSANNSNSNSQPARAPLHHIADPAGQVLETTLSPIGSVVSTITKPLTNTVGSITAPVLGPFTGAHEEKMEVLGGGNKDSYKHGGNSIAGREQTAENPLGLESQERWGFREEGTGRK